MSLGSVEYSMTKSFLRFSDKIIAKIISIAAAVPNTWWSNVISPSFFLYDFFFAIYKSMHLLVLVFLFLFLFLLLLSSNKGPAAGLYFEFDGTAEGSCRALRRCPRSLLHGIWIESCNSQFHNAHMRVCYALLCSALLCCTRCTPIIALVYYVQLFHL